MDKTRKATKNFSNPKEIILRWRAGETQNLFWALREYIYLSYKARQAFSETYHACPAAIAQKFGSNGKKTCTTQDVHDAMTDDKVMIRTGGDRDANRQWIVCTDSVERAKIKKSYKHSGKKASGQYPDQIDEVGLGNSQTSLGNNQTESPPKASGQYPEHQKILPLPPYKDKDIIRPEADSSFIHKEGEGSKGKEKEVKQEACTTSSSDKSLEEKPSMSTLSAEARTLAQRASQLIHDDFSIDDDLRNIIIGKSIEELGLELTLARLSALGYPNSLIVDTFDVAVATADYRCDRFFNKAIEASRRLSSGDDPRIGPMVDLMVAKLMEPSGVANTNKVFAPNPAVAMAVELINRDRKCIKEAT